MAKRSTEFDPTNISHLSEEIKKEKSELQKFQEKWGLYVPLVMGIATLAGFYAARTTNDDFREWYDKNYPILNGITMMVPAYFSWKTIRLKQMERKIKEKHNNVLPEKESTEREFVGLSGLSNNFQLKGII